MHDPSSAFWDFSLQFYGRPGVASACLELQDSAGADINVVLYLFYLAAQSRRLDEDAIAALDAATVQWRDRVVRPLRMARRHLKSCPAPFAGDGSAELRNAIKRDELAAERIEHTAIERLCPPRNAATAASPEAAIRCSLDVYGRRIAALPATARETLISLFLKQL